MIQKIHTPICIVGAGPAGLIASLNLSKHKIHHILLDKNFFPRDKVCGENFDGRVKHVLNRVVPGFFEELMSNNIIHFTHNFTIHLPNGKVPIQYDPSSTPRIMAKRVDFDKALFDKVNASEYVQIIQGDVVQDYYYEENTLNFQTKNHEIKAKLGLISCGYQSSLIKNRKLEKHTYFFSRAYYKKIAQLPKEDPKAIETYYFNAPVRCCLLICPIPNGEYNVEIGINKLDYKKLKIRLEDLLYHFIDQNAELKARFKNAVCIQKPKGVHLPITSQYKMFSDKNIMYMGAASFCVNPITGMGVGNAMVMGEEASQNAVECLLAEDYSESATAKYESAVLKKLRNPLLANRVVNFFFKHLNVSAPVLLFLIKTKSFVRLFSKQDFLKNVMNPRYYLKNLLKG